MYLPIIITFSYSICWYLSNAKTWQWKLHSHVFVQYLLIFIVWRIYGSVIDVSFSYSICWYLSSNFYNTIHSNYLFSYSICWYLSFAFALSCFICNSFSYSICWYLSYFACGEYGEQLQVFVQYLLIFIPLKIKVYKIYYRWK